MITKTGLLKEFNLISKGSYKFSGIPYTWQQEKGQSYPKLKTSRATFLLTGIALEFSGVIQAGSAFKMMYLSDPIPSGDDNLDGNTSSEVVNPNWASLIMISGLCFMHFANFAFDIYWRPERIEEWLTQTLFFEQLYINTDNSFKKGKEAKLKMRKITKFAVLTCRLVRISMFSVVPWIVALGSLVMPKNPVNLWKLFPGPMVMAGIEHMKLSYLMTLALDKLLTFVWNFFFYQFVMRTWAMLAIAAILGCMALSEAVLYFEREFPKRRIDQAAKSYREIQLLAKFYNRLMASHLVGTLVMAVNLETICALNVIGKKADPSLPLKLYCLWNVGNAIVGVAGLFGFCGDVYDTCINVLERIKTNRLEGDEGYMWKNVFKTSKERREGKRVLESLRVVHVSFGEMNYIEKLTPVVFQDFATQRLVDSLLLQAEEA